MLLEDSKLTERERLYNKFENRIERYNNLNRKIVSFQANKEEPFYRWFKYKEGFSSSLVKYFLSKYAKKSGKLLDPFAGAGTTLFAGQELGWETYGIELLPVGTFVIEVRQAINNLNITDFKSLITTLWNKVYKTKAKSTLNHIPITKDAFPEETEDLLNRYITYCNKLKNDDNKLVLLFAVFSVLEEISYTRKDGQYLRWDYRSKRNLSGKQFNKGKIFSFQEAVTKKLNHIVNDISTSHEIDLFSSQMKINSKPKINAISGSCLEELPKLNDNFFDFIITSPPYCNRYDYTRTYALELVFLGNTNDQVRNLRQTMLSCTVENKEKTQHLEALYNSFNKEKQFKQIVSVYNNSSAMSELNYSLEKLSEMNKLNNNNIPRMVRNYFFEMCFVIYEMARVTKKGGYCVMVNDNVRYGGEEIPVDLLLSEFAERFGFKINKILVLPKGKGNSSQQMGAYGRTEVRKCVYIWQKQ